MQTVKKLRVTALAAIVLAYLPCIYAQEQPPPVKVLVGTPAGGPADLLARLFAEAVRTTLGVRTVVENKPGAAGTIAARAASHAPANGQTVLIAGMGTMVVAPYLYPRTSDEASRELAPIGKLASSSMVLVVTPSLSASTVQELVGLASAAAVRTLTTLTTLTYGSAGHGSVNHVCAELFAVAAGISIHHVPFSGDAAAGNSIIAGDVQFMFMGPSIALPLVKAGRLRALAVTGASRLSSLPEAPTLMESGFAAFECRPWTMVFVPTGTPPARQDALSRAWAEALKLPGTRARIEAAGMEPAEPGGRLEAATFFRAEQLRYGQLRRESGLKVP